MQGKRYTIVKNKGGVSVSVIFGGFFGLKSYRRYRKRICLKCNAALLQSGMRHTYGANIEFYGADYHPESADSIIHYAIPVLQLLAIRRYRILFVYCLNIVVFLIYSDETQPAKILAKNQRASLPGQELDLILPIPRPRVIT